MVFLPEHLKLFHRHSLLKRSSQKFAHRGQTKELSYGGEGVWTRFVVRSTVKKKKNRGSKPGRTGVLTESNL